MFVRYCIVQNLLQIIPRKLLLLITTVQSRKKQQRHPYTPVTRTLRCVRISQRLRSCFERYGFHFAVCFCAPLSSIILNKLQQQTLTYLFRCSHKHNGAIIRGASPLPAHGHQGTTSQEQDAAGIPHLPQQEPAPLEILPITRKAARKI